MSAWFLAKFCMKILYFKKVIFSYKVFKIQKCECLKDMLHDDNIKTTLMFFSACSLVH